MIIPLYHSFLTCQLSSTMRCAVGKKERVILFRTFYPVLQYIKLALSVNSFGDQSSLSHMKINACFSTRFTKNQIGCFMLWERKFEYILITKHKSLRPQYSQRYAKCYRDSQCAANPDLSFNLFIHVQ